MNTQAPVNLVNGIDVDGLKETIAAIEANPAEAATQWTVTSQWQGGTKTDHIVDGVRIGGRQISRRFQIQVDEPLELCGTNDFANPQEYLLAATNACMMVGYSAVAAMMGIRLTLLELTITGDIDLRGFLGIDPEVSPGYDRLHYTVRIAGDGDTEQFEQLHATVQRTSPNYHNISKPIEMTCDLIVE